MQPLSLPNELHWTHAPVDIEAVRSTDDARLRGRKRIRAKKWKAGSVMQQHLRFLARLVRQVDDDRFVE